MSNDPKAANEAIARHSKDAHPSGASEHKENEVDTGMNARTTVAADGAMQGADDMSSETKEAIERATAVQGERPKE